MLFCFLFTCFLDSWWALSVWKFMFLSFENFPWNNYLVISYFPFLCSFRTSYVKLCGPDLCHFSTIYHLCLFCSTSWESSSNLFFNSSVVFFFMSTVIFTFSKSSFLFSDIPFYMTSFLFHGCNRSLPLA